VPYENLSDSLSTNCSATDAVDAVTLDKPLATNVAVDVAVPVAVGCGFASPSLTRVAPHVDADDVLTVADTLAVNPPNDATLEFEDTSAPLETMRMHDAVVLAEAVEVAGRTAEPNVDDPNVYVP
jgi:hypothetical protein